MNKVGVTIRFDANSFQRAGHYQLHHVRTVTAGVVGTSIIVDNADPQLGGQKTKS